MYYIPSKDVLYSDSKIFSAYM